MFLLGYCYYTQFHRQRLQDIELRDILSETFERFYQRFIVMLSPFYRIYITILCFVMLWAFDNRVTIRNNSDDCK